jgi:hypothetical protein
MTNDEQLVHIDKALLKKMEMLLQALENIYPSTKELIWKSFLKGIFIGLGTTIGVSIVLAALTYLLTSLRVFPIFNDIIEDSRVEDILLKN